LCVDPGGRAVHEDRWRAQLQRSQQCKQIYYQI
jgi:hypothetical protein